MINGLIWDNGHVSLSVERDVAEETRVPEWFIGGPHHGEDRAAKFPNAASREIWVTTLDPVGEFTYCRTSFVIGRHKLTIWVLVGMDQVTAADHLAAILLAPHQVPA